MRKTAVLVSVIMMVGMTAAASPDLPRPGQTPESPFYFLDRLSESLELAVAKSPLGSPELEAKMRANHAAERLSEAKKLAGKNKTGEVEKLMQDYSRQLNMSVKSAQGANSSELSRRLGNVTDNHVEVLQNVQSKVPEQAQKGIQKAIESSQRGKRELSIPGKSSDRGSKGGVPEAPGQGSGSMNPSAEGNGFEEPGTPGEEFSGVNGEYSSPRNMTSEEVEKRSERLTQELKETVGNNTQNSGNFSGVNESSSTAGDQLEGSENDSKVTGEAIEKPSLDKLP